MLTWNLPALIRNAVLFTLLCIFVDWNFMAWVFILFIIFAEMDEELTKYESYSDYYKAQLELYDFSKATTADGWNLEEQLRIFNQQNPQVVQQYQKTFKNRLQELRIKRPQSFKPQTKAAKAAHRKEEARLKQEVFGYTENHWDEQDTMISNEFSEVINHIGSTAMYEWYHLNGLTISEQEYGIKNICLYHDKYSEIDEDQEYSKIMQLSISELSNSSLIAYNSTITPWARLYNRSEKTEKSNNLLYWPMSGYQKAQYNSPLISKKINTQYADKRIYFLEHIKHLSDEPHQVWLVNDKIKLQTNITKQLQISLSQAERVLPRWKLKHMKMQLQISRLKKLEKIKQSQQPKAGA